MSQAVYFLLLPNVLSLDVSGPAETLRLAGQFSLRYLSPAPQIVCSIGMTLSGLQPLPERLEDGAILVLPGVGDSQRYFAGEEAGQARRWLATLRPPDVIERPRAGVGGRARTASSSKIAASTPARASPPASIWRCTWSTATAAPAGRVTSHATWWSISAAPATIRSCRPGCVTATTCTRRCTARRT